MMKDWLEYVIAQRATGARPEWFSDLFERLVWIQADNGASIHAALRDWLIGDELYRVEVALGCEEVFLFENKEDMLDCFANLSKRWPQLAKRCAEIIENWEQCGLDAGRKA